MKGRLFTLKKILFVEFLQISENFLGFVFFNSYFTN